MVSAVGRQCQGGLKPSCKHYIYEGLPEKVVSEQTLDPRAVGTGTGGRDLWGLGLPARKETPGQSKWVRQSVGLHPLYCGSLIVFSCDDMHQLTHLKPDPLLYTSPSGNFWWQQGHGA